ncbi:patatin-like phospholipase family protein [Thalassomonas sp. RHCl1]|uniref:patatin-like phospholipase family protein n=1 Tax=Thalassomonas sp. RHCl1 TaxID=2995320 RepID=UPI00248C350B|nr:patatin-like phospholipase family protein [Thalassomonas sp. RHCl1]
MDSSKKANAVSNEKRILSIDGGGIRGCLTLGYLQNIETIVRKELDKEDAVLSDYFDLIGGTSTGALIAAQLALGFDVATIRKNYEKLGKKVFSKPAYLIKHLPLIGRLVDKLYTKWSVKPLEKAIKEIISEKITLGSPSIKTGLCVVTKRADNFSTWPFINHPDGKFFEDNCDIPLWKILRASSAAPTFFKPIELDVGLSAEPDFGMFVDGGVSMANNPALQLFLIATLDGFPYHWSANKEDLLIVSVGTGFWKRRLDAKKLKNPWNIFWAQNVPEMLMLDACDNTELLMQYLSNSPTNRYINYEIGDLSGDLLSGKPSLSYVRYNVELETSENYRKYHGDKNPDIAAALSKYSEADIERLREMDKGSNTEELLKLGDIFAKEEVKAEHFIL